MQIKHHVPGRLRIKLPPVRKDPAKAEAVAGHVRTLEGVRSVEVNTVSASVIVHYDIHRVGAEAITAHLASSGHLMSHGRSSPVPGALGQTFDRAGSAFGKALFGIVLEKAVERVAVALVAALV